MFALAVGPDGSLYAGGHFANAGGVAASKIARWDGTQWQALGNGTNGDVLALAFGPDGSLYAGGSFTSAGSVPANYVARWYGGQWHALGSGMSGGLYYTHVDALAIDPEGSVTQAATSLLPAAWRSIASLVGMAQFGMPWTAE